MDNNFHPYPQKNTPYKLKAKFAKEYYAILDDMRLAGQMLSFSNVSQILEKLNMTSIDDDLESKSEM